MENILCLIYLVAHTVAALLSEILECCVVLAAYDLGMTAWGLTALWLALIVLDLLGWISVRKPEWRILAAALFAVPVKGRPAPGGGECPVFGIAPVGRGHPAGERAE